MNFLSVVEQVASYLELPPLSKNSSGNYVINFDEGLDVELFEKEEGYIYLSAWVADLPDEESALEPFLKKVLKVNLARSNFEHHYISMHPQSQKLILYNKMLLEGLELTTFIRILEDFVNTLESWKEILENNEDQKYNPLFPLYP